MSGLRPYLVLIWVCTVLAGGEAVAPPDSASMPPAIREHVGNLHSSDPEVQRQALASLKSLGKDAGPALPAILRLTAASDWKVSQFARSVLGELAPLAPNQLLPELGAVDSPYFRTAVDALAGCTLPALERQLLPAAASLDQTTRAAVCRALVSFYGREGHEETTRLLDKLLAADPAPLVHCGIAAAALSRLETDRSVEPLVILAMRDPSPGVLDTFLAAVGTVPSALMVQEALSRLDKYGGGPPKLVSYLDTWKTSIREAIRHAVTSMAASGNPDVRHKALVVSSRWLVGSVDELHHRLQAEKAADVRRSVAETILNPSLPTESTGLLPLAKAKQAPLEDRELALAMLLAEDPSPLVRRVALRALRRNASRDDVAKILHQAFRVPETRLAAFAALADAQLSLPEVLAALDDSDADLRELAIRRLGDLKLGDPSPCLRALAIAEKEPDLAQLVYTGVLRTGAQGLALVRERVLAKSGPRCRIEALGAIADVLPPEEARSILEEFREDSHEGVRAQSLALLGRLDRGSMRNSATSPAVLQPARYTNSLDRRELPEDPAALVDALWEYMKTPTGPGRIAGICSDEARGKLSGVLAEGSEPGACKAALLLAYIGEKSAARAVVAYHAFSLPRKAAFPYAHRFGLEGQPFLASVVLKHPHRKTRLAAFEELLASVSRAAARVGAPEAKSLQRISIELALHAPDQQVREQAVRQLGALLPDAQRSALADALKGESPALATLLEESARPVVKKDPSHSTRDTSPLDAAGVLTQAESASWVLRYEAAWRAGTVWTPAVQAAVFRLLVDPDARVRAVAASAISDKVETEPSILPELVALVKGENEEQQLNVLQHFPRQTEVWQAAQHLWNSSHPGIQLAMLQASRHHRIGKRGLRHLLDAPNRAVASAAANALGLE